MKRQDVFNLIDDERNYQDEQFKAGRWTRMSQSPMEFLADVRVYARKCEEEYVETGRDDVAVKRLKQIAALCVAAMEKNL